MRQEAHPRARVQVQQRLELLRDAHLRRLVRRRARPDADLVLLRADVDDDAADLVALGKLLADRGEERVEPHGVERRLGVLAPGDEDGPLAAVLARGVLPLCVCVLFEVEVERKKRGARSIDGDERKKSNQRFPPPFRTHLGLDPLLEQVQIRAVFEPRGGLDVVVEPVFGSKEGERE